MVNFQKIEKKWQDAWEKKKVFKVKESKKKKFFALEMLPYPSSVGLHMGHAFNYAIGDIYARFKRMNGFNVLYPMGYDSFGLPAENAAIKAKEQPKIYTEKAIKNFIKQQKALGLSYDWDRMLMTHSPEYYKWNQYFFLKLYEKGLVYRKKSPVNWCPKCDTVLANEQVHSGMCWRHKDTEVEIKHLEQWFIKTTAYAEELLRDIEKLDWPERIKIMQRNWIGKSYGTEINFKIDNENWPIFTTRPDTLYGVTFMVVSAQHPRLMDLVTKEQKKDVERFLKKIKSTSQEEVLEKEGAFTGSYALNPVTNEMIPVYTGNFVLAEYGSGIVMAVPAHDQRDFEFAKKYKIQIKVVIKPEYKLNPHKMSRAYVSEGTLVNSGEFNGENNLDAISSITKYLEKKKVGKKTVQYKLRDWLVSRQRYWGTPIPFVYCERCGLIPEKKLPVLLPDRVEFGKGNPLLRSRKFVNVKCPKCNGKAKRETDTMDTFFDSSWYFLRYCNNKNKNNPFDKNKVNYWMPVDQYIGGAEHACMHLIYARFFVKALRDMGFLNFSEPFIKLFNQGMLHGPDGNKMSKSLGNVIDPLDTIKEYSTDALRFFLVSVASPDSDFNWSDKGIQGCFKFINKVYDKIKEMKIGKSSKRIESKMNLSIKEVTEDIEKFRYNLALIKIKELFNCFEDEVSKKDLESFLKLLSCFCPHVCEELWKELGNKGFICLEKWPKYDNKKINLEFDAIDEFKDGLRSDLDSVMKLVKFKPKLAKISVAEDWKYGFLKNLKKEIVKTRDVGKLIKKLVDG